jgi:glycosyltransferase involved in cell wall biosynthesis
MRVLYVQPAYFDPASYIGGGERYPQNLARAVVAASDGGAEITIVSFGSEVKHFAIADHVELRILVGASRNANMFDATSAAITALIDRSDLVHVFQPFTRGGEAASLAGMARGVPVVLTDLGCLTSRTGEQSGLIGLVDALVCISKFSAARFLGYRHPCHVVASGPFDDAKFSLYEPAAEPRRSLLFVGRLLPHKGIDTVLRTLPPDLPFIVCGRPYDRKYFDLLRDLARGKRVTFVTDADDRKLTRLYREALAVILPSVHLDVYGNFHMHPELLGLTLLEGAASGCFAICRNIGGMPEFIGDADCGASFETDGELRELLASVASDRDRISSTAAVRKRAAWATQTHGLHVTGERVLKAYRQACH